jgi:pimeloyl-ACP methyl ester carboxylesterase
MSTRISRLAIAASVALVAISGPAGISTTLTAGSGHRVVLPGFGPWDHLVQGEVGPGALYALYVPTAWNGDAIYYVHGVRDVDSPVDLRDQDSFYATRDLLGAQGFAIAYSSWSDNGVAMKDGSQRVHQMRGILASELNGPPNRHFLMSHSLGSGIALDLVQTFPTQYDGALLMCGMVGGTLLQSQYAGHVRAVFDAFFPGYLRGNVIKLPPGTAPVTLNQVIAAVQSNPAALYAIASLAETPLPYVPIGNVFDPTSTAFQTLVGSLYGPLLYQTRFANNLLGLAHGHTTFDNATTAYVAGPSPLLPPATLQPILAFINASVERYEMDPAGRNFMEHNFTTTGDLRIPVLTLHNAWDPGVPAFHETALLQKATAAGATGNLLQRLYPGYGHCEFGAYAASVQAQNFLDMVTWVTTGTKPAW